MANGYYDVQGDPVDERVRYRRVPDNGLCNLTQSSHRTTNNHPTSDSKYMTSRTSFSSSGRTVEVHDHKKARIDDDEPRASKATYEDYKRSQERKDRRAVYVKS